MVLRRTVPATRRQRFKQLMDKQTKCRVMRWDDTTLTIFPSREQYMAAATKAHNELVENVSDASTSGFVVGGAISIATLTNSTEILPITTAAAAVLGGPAVCG